MTINEVADGTTPIRRDIWDENKAAARRGSGRWAELARESRTAPWWDINEYIPERDDLTATDWQRCPKDGAGAGE